MKTQFEEQYTAAQELKNNDINSYVWLRARTNDSQSEIRLVDATEEELNSFYAHCQSMLYNENKEHPGRYVLLDIIENQRMCCNTELFLHWIENTYKVSDRRAIPRSVFLQTINTCLKNNEDTLPRDRSLIPITKVASGIPVEFEDLTLDYIINGCLNSLGNFNKKHITLRFITNKLGLWLTPQELNEFSKEAREAKKSRLEIVKERCGIPQHISIMLDEHNKLNYKEFRALIQLKTKTYSTMTIDQLVVLRDKGLFWLAEEVRKHIDQWKTLKEQIEKVAEYKGYTIKK